MFFSKAETNPNVGNSIITLGYFGVLNETISESVALFNESNSEYCVTLKSYESDVSIDRDYRFSYRNYADTILKYFRASTIAFSLCSGHCGCLLSFNFGRL